MNYDKWRYYLRAQLYQFLGKETQALEAYRRAYAAAPDFIRALERSAFLHAKRGDFARAAENFRIILARQPKNALIHFNLGFACDKLGALEEAIAAFETAVRLNAQLDRAWYGLGICQARLGRHDKAAEALHEAATLQPMNPHAWYALGMAHHHLNQPERVTEIIKHLHRFDPVMTRHLIQDAERADLMYLVKDLVV